MRVEVIFRPANSLARVVLDPQETICLSRHAIVAASDYLELAIKPDGDSLPLNLPAAVNEEIFLYSHKAGNHEEQIFLAPTFSCQERVRPCSKLAAVVR